MNEQDNRPPEQPDEHERPSGAERRSSGDPDASSGAESSQPHVAHIEVQAAPPSQGEGDAAHGDDNHTLIVTEPGASRSIMLGLLVLVASVVALKAARVVVVPLVLAIVLSILLSPLVLMLRRIRIPTALGAAIVLAVIVGVAGAGVYYLTYPAAEWMEKLPGTIREVEWKLRDIKEPIKKVTEASKQVEQMTSGEPDDTPTVEIRQQSFAEILFSGTQAFLVFTTIVIILLYLLLASGDLFLQKLIRVQPHLKDKIRAVDTVQHIKHDVAHHLFTITVINLGLGAVVAGAMFLLGMPNPVLWGVMAAAFNFIPYLGAIAGIVIMTLVAFVTFDAPGQMVLPPLTYFFLTAIEGYVVTPMVLGVRLRLNPVVIVVGLLFWSWLWGIPGAVLAVPLLVIIKALCDRTKGLEAIGEFLGK